MLRAEKELEQQKPTANTPFKIAAFNNAINVIAGASTPVRSWDDEVLETRGIGHGIKKRINQYFLAQGADTTASAVERLRFMQQRALAELLELPGIGPAKAEMLVGASCTGSEDLFQSWGLLELLPSNVQLGLKYLGYLDSPASRAQVEEALKLIHGNLSPKYEVIPVGAYRRGLAESPTITFVVLHPDHVHVPVPTAPNPFAAAERDWSIDDPVVSAKNRAKKKKAGVSKKEKKSSLLHAELVPLLQQRQVLCESISEAPNSWTGVVRLPSATTDDPGVARRNWAKSLQIAPGEYRRIAFHFVPQRSRSAGLLKYTGDSGLEELLQVQARALDMHLNEYGLWKWKYTDPAAQVPVDRALAEPDLVSPEGFWSLVNAFSEECLFRELNFAYVDPTKRNFNFLNKKRRTGGR